MRRFKRRYIPHFTLFTDSNVTIKQRRKMIKSIVGVIKIQEEVFGTDPYWKNVAEYFLHRLRYNLFNNMLKGVRI